MALDSVQRFLFNGFFSLGVALSSLRFDGIGLTLQLYSDTWELLGEWPANNRPDSKSTLRFIPNGRYSIFPSDKTAPHSHGSAGEWKGHGKNRRFVIEDSTPGSYGPFGIIRLSRFYVDKSPHDGVGIHSGRNNDFNHYTRGCIRTTDVAMSYISEAIKNDPLLFIVVQNNFDHNATGRVAHHNGRLHHKQKHHNKNGA